MINPRNSSEMAAMSSQLQESVSANRQAAGQRARKVKSELRTMRSCPVASGKPLIMLEDDPLGFVHELLLAGCTAVIVLGGYTEAQVREALGDAANRVTIVANGSADYVVRISARPNGENR